VTRAGTVGTWAWAQRTHGRLSRRDRIELIRQGALARTADELVRELSAPPLYAHCVRTWLFAALFAACDRVDHDPELLYLACALHDLGLTDAHDRRDPTAACFAVEGARAAHELMRQHDQPSDRARTVAEAISLHLNITVPARLGAEAQLLSKGVSLDVVGRRADRLPGAVVHEVGQRWPRDGFSDHLNAAIGRQAEIRPQSRAALLRRLGFAKLVSGNPIG